jgi:hypothetical protein
VAEGSSTGLVLGGQLPQALDIGDCAVGELLRLGWSAGSREPHPPACRGGSPDRPRLHAGARLSPAR